MFYLNVLPNFTYFTTIQYQKSVRIRTVYRSECGKVWTRITPNTDTFHAVTVIVSFETFASGSES